MYWTVDLRQGIVDGFKYWLHNLYLTELKAVWFVPGKPVVFDRFFSLVEGEHNGHMIDMDNPVATTKLWSEFFIIFCASATKAVTDGHISLQQLASIVDDKAVDQTQITEASSDKITLPLTALALYRYLEKSHNTTEALSLSENVYRLNHYNVPNNYAWRFVVSQLLRTNSQIKSQCKLHLNMQRHQLINYFTINFEADYHLLNYYMLECLILADISSSQSIVAPLQQLNNLTHEEQVEFSAIIKQLYAVAAVVVDTAIFQAQLGANYQTLLDARMV